jgi:hypothetical protein
MTVDVTNVVTNFNDMTVKLLDYSEKNAIFIAKTSFDHVLFNFEKWRL